MAERGPAPAGSVRRAQSGDAWVAWFGVLGGALAWTAHLLGSYALVSLACATGLVVLLHLMTLATGLIALAATVLSWRRWRQVRRRESAQDLDQTDRRGFLALAGTLLSGLLFVLILVEGLPSLLLSPCAR